MASPAFYQNGTLSSGTASPRAPSYPSTTTAGQVALCFVTAANNGAIGFPADWAMVGQQNSNGTGLTAAVAWKRLDGSEGGKSISVTVGSGTSVARIVVFNAALDVGTPYESFGSQAGTGTAFSSGPTNLTYIDRLAIRAYFQAANGTVTTPTGWTNLGASGVTGLRLTAHAKAEAAAGSETATSPTSSTSAAWLAFDFALLPTNEATTAVSDGDASSSSAAVAESASFVEITGGVGLTSSGSAGAAGTSSTVDADDAVIGSTSAPSTASLAEVGQGGQFAAAGSAGVAGSTAATTDDDASAAAAAAGEAATLALAFDDVAAQGVASAAVNAAVIEVGAGGQFAASASAGSAASAAIVTDGEGTGSSAAVLEQGSGATTEADDTVVASAGVQQGRVVAAVAIVEDGDTLLASDVEITVATVALTMDDDGLALGALAPDAASFIHVGQGEAVTTQGAVPVAANLSRVLGTLDTFAARAGAIPLRAYASIIADDDVSTALTTVKIGATAGAALDDDTVSARSFQPKPYVASNVAKLFKSSTNLGVFWRLGTKPALHLWMGVGDVPIGIPSLDPDGTIYIGAGKLLQVPDLELLINGVADRIEFTLSGVSAEFQAMLNDTAPDVTGARCTVGIAPLDARWQPLSPILGVWSGTADFMSMEQKPAKPGKPSVRGISVSVGSGDTSRARPRLTGFTDPQQKILSPTDKFCDRTPRYTQDYLVAWPHF